MWSYDAGFWAALALGILAAVVAGRLFIGTRVGLVSMVPFGCAVFSAAFSITNIVFQADDVDQAFLRAEIANGRLGLRVTSLLFVYSYTQRARFIRSLPLHELSPGWDVHSHVEIIAEQNRETTWSPDSLNARTGVYAVGVALLWTITARGHDSLSSSLLNWLVAFTLDDFNLLVDNRLKLGVTPLRRHDLQLRVGQIVLLGLLGIVLFQEFTAGFAVLSFGLVLLIVALPWVGRWFRLILAGVETIGIIDFDDPPPDHPRGRIVDDAAAIEELRQLVGEQKRLLGDDAPSTLATRFSLAMLLGQSGKTDEAVLELHRLLTDHTRLFGPDASRTLAVRHCLDHWLQQTS